MLDFAEAKYEVDESCGTCIVKVVRSGITDKSCSIQFDTSDGDASSTDDYVSTAGTLQFKADETEKEISITIIDDNEWAPDKHFFVRLYGAKAEENSGVEIKVNTATTQVIILNDDDPGSIGFQAKTFHAMDPCPFSCGVLSACFDSYVAIVSVDTACNGGCGFCCWLHVHLHAAACAWLVFGGLGLLGLWRALRPGPGGARCSGHWSRLRIAVVLFSRPPPAGNPPHPLPCCGAHAAPVQYSARAGLQVTRICPQMPAAGVLKAHCQGGLLAPPPPSCWVLHVRGL